MKRTLTAAALAFVLCLTAAAASGGDTDLISRSYLETSFAGTLRDTILTRLDASDRTLRAALLPGGGLREGDALSASPGASVTLLEGEASLSGGTVVDVTEGRELASGPLKAGHRYLTAESAVFTVVSSAASAFWEGDAILIPSDRPDYSAIADALQSLDLFRGTGSGFDLDRAPTRGEGLVMFVRMLGEEADALACTDSHPFTDVPGWLDRYAAWAWRQGYSNGVSAVSFDPDRPISSGEYVELLLRALGYSTAGADSYETALERARESGVLTEGEYGLLRTSPFLRAHAAYLSYYALDIPTGGTGQTLAQRMTAGGLLTPERLSAARDQVKTLRLT